MGFKDIEKFNNALLAEQVWQMLNNPNSMSQSVQSQIFPDSSVLDAKDSTTGSYTQKSIISARDMIRKGMVWQIGNGNYVQIKEDKWLLVNANRSIITPLPTFPVESKVQTLRGCLDQG